MNQSSTIIISKVSQFQKKDTEKQSSTIPH